MQDSDPEGPVGSKEGEHCGVVSIEVLWALGVAVCGMERSQGRLLGWSGAVAMEKAGESGCILDLAGLAERL